MVQPLQDHQPHALPGPCHGREPCRALLRQALLELAAEAAAPRGAPAEAWLVDPSFDDWPLDEVAVLDSLSAWLRPGGRCLRLLGVDFETTARALPRFARWRRDWSHRLEVSCPADGPLPDVHRGLLLGRRAWQRLEGTAWRLLPITDPAQVRTRREQLAAYLQRCEPAWPATHLGL